MFFVIFDYLCSVKIFYAMQNKKNLKRKITVLYIVYFAALLGGIVYNTAPAFKQGARLGLEVSKNIMQNIDNDVIRSSHLYLGIHATQNHDIAEFDKNDDRNTSVTVSASNFDVLVSQDADDDSSLFDMTFSAIGGSAFIYFGSLAIMALYITIFVLTFLILHSLHRSVKRDMPLDKKCVWYTRSIGIILIVTDLLDAWGQWFMRKEAAGILAGSEFIVDTSFPLNYYKLLLAVLVIFTAEIFAIGSQLGEDQKLTI